MSDVSELPAWVNILVALLTPTVAVVALILGIFNYRLAARRRRDDLFDRRYKFYERVRSIWLSTGTGAADGQRPWLDIDDLLPLAEEADSLFGNDIAKHILSLADRQHSGHGVFMEHDFVAPFRKYLAFY